MKTLTFKLATKTALLTAMFTILGMVLVTNLSFRKTMELLDEQASDTVSHYLDHDSRQIYHKLNDLKNTSLSLAQSDLVVQTLTQPKVQHHSNTSSSHSFQPQSLVHLFSTFMRHNPAYRQITLLDVQQKEREIVRLERLNNQEIVTVTSYESSNEKKRTYYKKALTLKPGLFYISDIIPNQKNHKTLSDQASIRISVPVYGQETHPIGVLTILVNLHYLSNFHTGYSKEIFVFLVNAEGHHLDSPEQPGVPFFKGFSPNQTLQEKFPEVDFNLSPEQKSLFLIPTNGPIFSSPITQKRVHNRTMDLVFQRIYFDPSDIQRHLIAVALSSRKSIEIRSWHYWHHMLEISLPIALFLSILIALATHKLTLPIRHLTQVAHRIALGEEGVQPPSGGNDEVGELAKAFQTMLDRQRQTNTDLKNLAVSLEEQVKERTLDLAVARDEALAASQAKSTFLATMSHEIRTPMNVVLGMLELLQETDMNLQSREHVALAFSSGKSLLSLINNILDLSKIEAQQITLDKVDFNLRHQVDEAAMTVAPLAHAKEIELTAFFPEVPYTAVRGDPIRLKQIFTNLMGNAIKFTPEGGSVELHGGPVSSNDKQIYFLFEVRDTGIGIPPDDRDKIFQQFIQADSSSTRCHEGTGLGLSICKHLLNLMGGEIDVEDNPYANSGSIFNFTVQIDKQNQSYDYTKKEQLFKDIKVLAISSDGLQRTLIENVLIPRGARLDHVTEMDSAAEIINQATTFNNPYQLVIFNQKLGASQRREFRQLLNLSSELRFILLTDLLDQAWDQATQLPGTAICLKKPINAERLLAATDWLVNNSQSQGSIPTIPPPSNWSHLHCTASILVVDDQQANLTVTRGMLVNIGCDPKQVSTATHGQEAIELFLNNNFGLILMDCHMPVMDGFDATQTIREWETTHNKKRTPIVAFTADITQKSRENIKASGMDGLLAKPVTRADLGEQLQRFSILQPNDESPQLQPNQKLNKSTPSNQKPNQTSKTVDMVTLLNAMKSIGLQEDDFREVADLLSSQFLELLETMQRDFEQQAYESARATAHVVKGSMANTIFPNLQRPTRTLYEHVREQNWEEALQELNHVKTLFGPIQSALLTFLADTN